MARKSRWTPQADARQHSPALVDTWIYGRISTEHERNAESVDNQIAIVTEHIAAKPDLMLRGVYRDDGISGTVFNRPGYNEMLKGILAGTVRCVAVKDLSRLGRDYIEIGELLFKTFAQHDVRFISVNDYYDSGSEDARRKRLHLLFKNLVNHMYSRDLGGKIRSAHGQKQKRGEPLGCRPPYGYMFVGTRAEKRLAIQPEAAEVVRMIFSMRAQGHSTVKIAEYLNLHEYPSPFNHYYNLGLHTNEKYAQKILWQNGYLCNLLINEVYTGSLVQGKYERHGKKAQQKPKEEWVVHENAHPAIVDAALFGTVQALMDEAREKYKKRGNSLDENIFVGKVFCSRCGKAAKRGYYRKNKTETRYNYFCRDCHGELRHTHGQDAIRRTPLEDVENTVRNELQMKIDTCLDIGVLLDEVSRSTVFTAGRNALLTERRRLEQSAMKAEEMLTNAYTHHLTGILDAREFTLARVKFERDKSDAEAGLERNRLMLEQSDVDAVRKKEWLAACHRFTGFERMDREMITALVERIDIAPMSNEVIVTLAFQDSFTGSEQDMMKKEVVAHDG